MPRKRVSSNWKRHAGNAAKVVGGGILGAALAGPAGAAAGVGVGASLAKKRKGEESYLKRGVKAVGRALSSGSPSHQMLAGERRKELNQYKKEGFAKKGDVEGRWVTARGRKIFIPNKKGK